MLPSPVRINSDVIYSACRNSKSMNDSFQQKHVDFICCRDRASSSSHRDCQTGQWPWAGICESSAPLLTGRAIPRCVSWHWAHSTSVSAVAQGEIPKPVTLKVCVLPLLPQLCGEVWMWAEGRWRWLHCQICREKSYIEKINISHAATRRTGHESSQSHADKRSNIQR